MTLVASSSEESGESDKTTVGRSIIKTESTTTAQVHQPPVPPERSSVPTRPPDPPPRPNKPPAVPARVRDLLFFSFILGKKLRRKLNFAYFFPVVDIGSQ
jgi:hypothetical protein